MKQRPIHGATAVINAWIGGVAGSKQVGAAPWRLGRVIDTTADQGRRLEILAQVRDIFQEQRLVPERNVVEEHQVLMNLAHVANMRHDRQSKLSRQKTDGDEL